MGVEYLATGRPYSPLGGTGVYPVVGMGREFRYGKSLSPTRRVSGAPGTGHRGKTTLRAAPIHHLEGLGCVRR